MKRPNPGPRQGSLFPEDIPSGKRLIFRPYRTLPNGKVLWARNYGLRAWPIWVDA